MSSTSPREEFNNSAAHERIYKKEGQDLVVIQRNNHKIEVKIGDQDRLNKVLEGYGIRNVEKLRSLVLQGSEGNRPTQTSKPSTQTP